MDIEVDYGIEVKEQLTTNLPDRPYITFHFKIEMLKPTAQLRTDIEIEGQTKLLKEKVNKAIIKLKKQAISELQSAKIRHTKFIEERRNKKDD